MKKYILAFATLSVFAACKNSAERTLETRSSLGEMATRYLAFQAGSAATDVTVNKSTSSTKPVVVEKEVVKYESSSSNPALPAKKKGWSKAAKGAVIGGAGGAITGAVISKKKGKGAIIGGVIGAATGYVIGRDMDRKDGRVKKD